ncbi:hypothetical protein L596_020275 [Steinernema carpocapsae]|uniref:G-patch domain-containing protein n=1 Tax=Steinernema carpocapsae TaxID=34508 RepID=A0A4U5MT15_STECR|nr:hypothetical protein L596_020275 [Steinernema carpocapsae]
MSDEEGNESFSINDRDLFYALNPHKRKRMSKEQQIYGVWADREEEEDATDERPSFSSAAKTMMNFVSGGTQKTGEDQQEEEKEVPVKKPKVSSNYPSAAKNQVFAGMRDAAGPKIDWAKGSKGNVIMNMMKKMGYEHGKGLGATKQGIVEPVEAKVRPGRAAIGAYGSEAKGLKNLDIDNEDVEVQDDLPKPSSGKSKKSGAKQKVSYRTIDEVLEEEGGARFDMGSAGGSKIIDMTSPVQKVYNDYNAFSTRSKTAVVARQGFDVPDLTRNLDMLLGMSEDEIRKNDNEARNRKAENEVNEVHLKELDEVRKQQHDRVRSLEQIIGILDLFSENTGEQSLDDYKELILRLKKLGYTRFGFVGHHIAPKLAQS